jgi:ABC-type transport system involved in cytochrome bd biosynthesis fused ATPase/permease subunit
MFWKRQDKSFVAVALSVIFIGAAIFAFGVSGWLINFAQEETIVAFPSIKVMGGLIIMSLGYIQLELGLLRNK